MLPLAPLYATRPLKVLPPSRGMTLKTTPAVSASPSPPDMLTTISCEPATFTTAAFEFAPAHPMLRPSDRVRESDGRPPCKLEAPPPVPPVMPPESPLVTIPGMIAMMPVAFLEVGIAEITSLLIVVCTFALWTSTIGVSPVTVIVSASAPTFSSALIVATNVPVNSMPSRFTVLKPVSENVTE